jgi:integrase
MASVFKKGRKGPWIIKYYDALGRRRERSSRTTDKRAAMRIAAQLESGVALRRDGVIDPRMDQMAEENARPVREHVSAYLGHLRHADRSPLTIRDAELHLRWILEETKASRLSDLTLDAVERALSLLQDAGRSARTINHRGGSVRGFLNWCVKTGRLDANPLRFLPKQNEELDRRRERRALTDEEADRLLEVAEGKGRKLWYMLALLAGLRRSEIIGLRWSDVNLDNGILLVRGGKARRLDEVPLHSDLLEELAKVRSRTSGSEDRVFATAVTHRTRLSDFYLAGLGRKEIVTDESGAVVMKGRGKNAKPKTRIVAEDEDGCALDLHALRSTLATRLARAGVVPQVAQRIMRHSDYSTTLKHYTRLELSDTAKAMAQVPRVGSSNTSPHHCPHQSEHQDAHSAAG